MEKVNIMAFKVTRNSVKANYSNIYYVGYCEMYHMLSAFRKVGFSSGVYGWNYNVYEIDIDTCVVTGYRGMYGKRIERKQYEKFEKKAAAIYRDPENRLPYEKRQEKIRKMTLKFFDNLKKSF